MKLMRVVLQIQLMGRGENVFLPNQVDIKATLNQ